MFFARAQAFALRQGACSAPHPAAQPVGRTAGRTLGPGQRTPTGPAHLPARLPGRPPPVRPSHDWPAAACPQSASAGDYTGYYYGPDHPMKPQRIAMTHQLILGYGLHKHLDVYVSIDY